MGPASPGTSHKSREDEFQLFEGEMGALIRITGFFKAAISNIDDRLNKLTDARSFQFGRASAPIAPQTVRFSVGIQ